MPVCPGKVDWTMRRLATELRMALFTMLRELDECDLTKLCREACEMVKTNRELSGPAPPTRTEFADRDLGPPFTDGQYHA